MNDSMFKEAEYLVANPDVAAAVKEGRFLNGYEHYLMSARRRGVI